MVRRNDPTTPSFRPDPYHTQHELKGWRVFSTPCEFDENVVTKLFDLLGDIQRLTVVFNLSRIRLGFAEVGS